MRAPRAGPLSLCPLPGSTVWGALGIPQDRREGSESQLSEAGFGVGVKGEQVQEGPPGSRS